MKTYNLKNISLILLSAGMGAGIYDLAINLRINYNEDTLKVYCKKGKLYEQVHQSTDVYVKTKLECINETIKGEEYDNTRRNNSTQK